MYDLILAFDDRILKACPNARFLTESNCSWIDRRSGNASPSPIWTNPTVVNYKSCDVSKKRFGVSFLTSDKGWLPGHKLRLQIFDFLPTTFKPNESYLDLEIIKHKSPPRINDKRETLEPYKFSIVAENCQTNGYYTEKVVDCFIAKTFPIYCGCPNLRDFFNPEGFLMFENMEHLKERLHSITPSLYEQRREAIEENFNIALKSVHTWDLMENYITEGIENKKNGNPYVDVVSARCETSNRRLLRSR
jgi:hypothetical protein